MKKSHIFTTALLVFFSYAAQAQQKIIIHLDNDQVIEKYVWEVGDIQFKADEDPVTSVAPAATDAVDLGLSVKWSPVNLEAKTQAGDTFKLFGWGDITGKNQSDKLQYFPTTHPKANIYGDKNYDLAQLLWGDKWRLPSDKEIQELITQCTWVWDGENSRFIISKTGADISSPKLYLPATGIRLKGESSDAAFGFYWSGIYDTSDDSKALALQFSETGKDLVSQPRYMGLAIRPVYGSTAVQMQFAAAMVGTPGATGANVSVTYTLTEGTRDQITEYGICYGIPGNPLDYQNGLVLKGTQMQLLSDQSFSVEYTLTALSESTSYEVLPYVVADGKVIYGTEKLTFETTSRFPVAEIVDLGLSVKWSSWNLGATQAGDYGGYYGWGDATGTLTTGDQTQYATNFAGSSIYGDPHYDIAANLWKDKWRLPTEAEIMELYKCNPQYALDYQGSGVDGYLFTGINGHSNEKLFIPMAGYYQGSASDAIGEYACLWTGTFNSSTFEARYVQMFRKSGDGKWGTRALRFTVRPVYAEAGTVIDDPNTGGNGSGNTDNPGNTDDPNSGETPVTPPVQPSAGNAVDLGLSVKWADRNVGASSSSGSGYYFSWGETQQRSDLSFTVRNYPYWSEGGGYQNIGDVLSAQYDAATQNWGGKWRMPTYSEMYELVDWCTWEWQGNGYKVTSNINGQSIFFPISKYNFNGMWWENYGLYWTSTLYDRHNESGEDAYSMIISESDYGKRGQPRYTGGVIRPVCP